MEIVQVNTILYYCILFLTSLTNKTLYNFLFTI